MTKRTLKVGWMGILIGLAFTSCSKFLDKESYSYASDGFYTKEEGLKQAVVGIYPALYIDLNWAVNAVIVMDHYTPLALEGTVQNTSIGAGAGLIPSNASVNTLWRGMYALVARANNVIDGSEDVIDEMGEEAKQHYAEARVLRAYAYYNLVGLFGDVPFFTAPVRPDQYKDEKSPKEEVLRFVVSELEAAAEALPWTAPERGRVDKAVAYGLQARAALLGGSLNYENQGDAYFKMAAAAAEKVIGKRNLATNFNDLFNRSGQNKADVRDELLWEVMYSRTASIQKTHTTGWGHSSRNYGSSVRFPSKILADTYECIDGKRIDESPLFDPRQPNLNRDSRFSATLRMHGDTVDYFTSSGANKMILNAYQATTQFYNPARGWFTDANQDVSGSNATSSFTNAGAGYVWYKFANETTEELNAQSCNIPILRYAEVLLSYAEAKIELGELDQSVYDALDAVRLRAGMPNVGQDRKGNPDKMRQLVRRERKVELILEGLHSIDMRRWKIGDIANAEPSYGVPLPAIRYEGLTDSDIPNFKQSDRHDLNDIPTYSAFKDKLRVRDVNRYWDAHFSLWPIPQIELDRNPNLTQNEGYH